MLEQAFSPIVANGKLITLTAASQSIDVTTTDTNQIEVTNTSTAAVGLKFGTTAAALTATIADGDCILIPAGATRRYSIKKGINRFAAIGLAANGYLQILPGSGI